MILSVPGNSTWWGRQLFGAAMLLMLAAHGLRFGDWSVILFWTGMGALLFSSRTWMVHTARLGLAGGAVSWLMLGTTLVEMRQAMDQPWLRLALIMAALAGASLLAAVLAQPANASGEQDSETMSTAPNWAPALAAALTMGGLWMAVTKASLPVLLSQRYVDWLVWPQVLGMGLYAGWLCRTLLLAKRTSRLRIRLWSAFSALFFGQLVLGLLGMEQMLMTGNLHLPVPALILGGPLYRGEGLFMPILFLVTILLVGPAWCSHLCYIGAWDGVASTRTRLPARGVILPGWTRYGRWMFLGLTISLALGLKAAGVPPMMALMPAFVFGLAGVGLMVFVSRRLGIMTHCTAWCPMGLVANLLGRLTPWRIKFGKGCTGCGVCARSCRYGAITPRLIEQGGPGLTCSLCGDCVTGCPHAAAQYSFLGMNAEASRTLFLVLVTALHAVFMAVARI